MNQKQYQKTLPRKRVSAGCLFFDRKKRLLVVNPTYKDTWEIPGGTVEKNESPREAVIREIEEELGLVLEPQRLLCIDYSAESDSRTESLQFIFLGPRLTQDQIAAIKLPLKELSEYRFLKPQKAVRLLNGKLRRRVQNCLTIINSSETLYLEGQQLVSSVVPG
ncbi:MAG: NUDIX hydrolase [Candidatus Promineifilaceae bacterium]|nr:NUDIX hydrolase [Candidatus Promineifilaceae bacterium]